MEKEVKNIEKLAIVSDVDGVLTSGNYFYTKDGKVAKEFGRDDTDGVKAFFNAVEILGIKGKIFFTSADKSGFSITAARIEPLKKCHKDAAENVELCSMNQQKRMELIKDLRSKGWIVLYIGDSFVDLKASLTANLHACPANAHSVLKFASYSHYVKVCPEIENDKLVQIEPIIVSQLNGGDGAFADILIRSLCALYSNEFENFYDFINKCI